VVSTSGWTGGTTGQCSVTGFPASLVVQPGDLLWHTASSGYLMVSARSALNGSGAGSIYGIGSGTATWSAADALQIRRPLPSAMASHFSNGGLILPAFNSYFGSATPSYDWYMQPAPEAGLNLYMAVSAQLRGPYNYSEGRRLLLRNWADTTTIETFSWDDHYANAYGGTFDTAGSWSDLSVVFQVTSPTALTDWRYKAKFTHVTGGGSSVMYVGAVSVYWSDEPLGAFRWSYQGGSHKSWDYGNDELFDRSDPLVNYTVQVEEVDPTKPFVLGGEVELRHRTLSARPKIVAWRRELTLGSQDYPQPELELDNRPPNLVRQLAERGSV